MSQETQMLELNPNEEETRPYNPYDNSVKIELDWETNNERMERAVLELSEILNIAGHRENVLKHIKAFLIIAARMEKYGHDKYVSYSRDNNFDGLKTLRNPKEIMLRKMWEVIDPLIDLGWLEHKKGINYPMFKRRSRFKAKQPLRDYMDSYGLAELSYFKLPVTGGVILKDINKKIIDDYTETNETAQMKEELEAYNNLILRSQISLERQITDEPYFFDNILSFRIFNNGSFKQGGRFYGGWWASCKKVDRPYILINEQPTVELDYKANHLCMIYGLERQPMPLGLQSDPYELDGPYPRDLIKIVFMMAINAGDDAIAHLAFAQNVHGDEELQQWKGLTSYRHYSEMVQILTDHHPIIISYLHTGAGLKLMYHDSRVAAWVLNQMTNEGVPCLCVHDSFIVSIEHEGILRRYMNQAYSALDLVYGQPRIKRKSLITVH